MELRAVGFPAALFAALLTLTFIALCREILLKFYFLKSYIYIQLGLETK